jgi:hypothetical protein
MNTSERITEYLEKGGLFNPELMEHCLVRDLLIDCRKEVDRLISRERSLMSQNDLLKATVAFQTYNTI